MSRALLLASWLFVSACGPRGAIMSGEFAACAKADLGAIVASSGLPLARDVVQKIKGNAATLEADLAGLAQTFGFDAVTCAIAAATAALQTPAPGAGSAQGPTLAWSPGLARAQMWAKGQPQGSAAK